MLDTNCSFYQVSIEYQVGGGGGGGGGEKHKPILDL